MGTYKVIQDIEAEDKLLGPLSLRQFIYAIIVIVLSFMAFTFAKVNIALVIPFLPPIAFFGILAAPFSKDQSSEVWLLAKIRFFLKPRKRIWDQNGIKELVTVTAPKKIEKVFIKDLSQTEVRSRLEALSNTIDSRGWVVKNVNVNLFAQPSYVLGQIDSDRLIDPSLMGQDVPSFDVSASEDILDTQNSRAQALDQLIQTSTSNHKQQIAQTMQNPPVQQAQPADYWFMNQNPQTAVVPGMASFTKSNVVLPGQGNISGQVTATGGTSDAEKALLDKIHADKARPTPGKSHLKTLRPLSEQKPVAPPPISKPAPDPTITSLAGNNDLNIETIARQANKKPKTNDDNEVVISLR